MLARTLDVPGSPASVGRAEGIRAILARLGWLPPNDVETTDAQLGTLDFASSGEEEAPGHRGSNRCSPVYAGSPWMHIIVRRPRLPHPLQIQELSSRRARPGSVEHGAILR